MSKKYNVGVMTVKPTCRLLEKYWQTNVRCHGNSTHLCIKSELLSKTTVEDREVVKNSVDVAVEVFPSVTSDLLGLSLCDRQKVHSVYTV